MNVVSTYRKSFIDWNLQIDLKIITNPKSSPPNFYLFLTQDNNSQISSVQLLGLLPEYNSATISTRCRVRY
jgi:hypothetical protein